MITQAVPTLYFFGVTTAQSSSRKMFPLWTEILGLSKAQWVGVDFPLNAPSEQYRAAVEQIKYDPLSCGALVTTHKVNVLNAARNLFEELTADATLCNEVACIYKDGLRLIGHAVDPETSGKAMQYFIPPGYWARTKAEILCLGAGGSAVAIAAHLLRNTPATDRPRRVTFVNRSAGKLAFLKQLEQQLPPTGIEFVYIENSDPQVNDSLMAALPAESMVINATGMGKDTPGSPLNDAAIWPEGCCAWELNYRGELDFMQQALRQRESRGVRVEDGWVYFVLGWSEVVSRVFSVPITPERFEALATAAATVR
jgi:shikimate 5-dehydrogenase